MLSRSCRCRAMATRSRRGRRRCSTRVSAAPTSPSGSCCASRPCTTTEPPRATSTIRAVRIGALAVQGNFREHAAMLRSLGAEVVEVRLPAQLAGLDALVIPGGESTAIMRLIRLYGLEEAIRAFDAPVFGTCAGMILLDREHLGLVDIDVERNGYGRQLASFEADLDLADGKEPLRGVFIRAPRVTETGPGVEVLASHEGVPVLLREGRFLVAAFHPELTADTRVHQRFLELIREEQGVRA